jgi:hypothetical protein
MAFGVKREYSLNEIQKLINKRIYDDLRVALSAEKRLLSLSSDRFQETVGIKDNPKINKNILEKRFRDTSSRIIVAIEGILREASAQ